MNRAILDASAVLALLHNEAGADRILPLVGRAVLSAVNAAEVQEKLVRLGIERQAAWDVVTGTVQEVIAFDAKQAEIAGNLVAQTSPLGLSLGDRACLALGKVLRLPVYTADRVWKDLRAGVEINLIR